MKLFDVDIKHEFGSFWIACDFGEVLKFKLNNLCPSNKQKIRELSKKKIFLTPSALEVV